jgi:hypothetical protein
MSLRFSKYSPRQRASTERKPISGVQRRRPRTGMPNDTQLIIENLHVSVWL